MSLASEAADNLVFDRQLARERRVVVQALNGVRATVITAWWLAGTLADWSMTHWLFAIYVTVSAALWGAGRMLGDRAVGRMGFAGQPMESLVKMRIFKVTPEFIAEARGEGLGDLSIEDLVKMKIFKIDSAFIRRAKADGVPLEIEELVRRRIGVRDRNFQE